MKDIVKKEQKLQVRNKILEAEKALITLVDGKNIVKGDTKVFPLEHMFVDGVYIRQMDMKKDTVVVGAIHKHLHVWFLLKGDVTIATEDNT